MPQSVMPASDLDELPASPDTETAFTRAYDTEHPRVYGYIRSRVQDGSTADDLTAQTFMKALDRLDTFDPDRGSDPQRTKASVLTFGRSAAGAGCRSTG